MVAYPDDDGAHALRHAGDLRFRFRHRSIHLYTVLRDTELGSLEAGTGNRQSRRSYWLVAVLAASLMLLLFVELLAHTSQSPNIAGRYSRAYFTFLTAYGVFMATAIATFVLVPRIAPSFPRRITSMARRLRQRRWLVVAAVAVPILAIIISLEMFQEYAIARSDTLLISIFGLFLLGQGVLHMAGKKGRDRNEVAGRIVLVIVGLTIALAIVEITLRRVPTLIPDAARSRLPGGGKFLRRDLVFDKPILIGFRYQPLINLPVEYHASNGDLYRLMPDQIQPQNESQNSVLAKFQFTTDENGYLNQPVLADRYAIVASGDSFTAPGNVSAPWPRQLEGITGLNVLNLGMPGYSPRAEVEAIKQFGLARKPNWVIVAYFEGNDLLDSIGFEAKQESGLSWIEHDLREAGLYGSSVAIKSFIYGFNGLVQPIARFIPTWLSGESPARRQVKSRYPISLKRQEGEIELAFYDQYVSMLTASKSDIEQSRNFDLVSQPILELNLEVEQAGGELLIVYVPSKEHVYLPVILRENQQAMPKVLQGVPMMILGPGGYLVADSDSRITPERLLDNLNGQRDALVSFANERELNFLDLTPWFQIQAASGVELYYFADTHWNQDGHDLAAKIIAEQIRRTSLHAQHEGG